MRRKREAQAARVQLQLAGIGRVRRVTSFEVGEPLELEVNQESTAMPSEGLDLIAYFLI